MSYAELEMLMREGMRYVMRYNPDASIYTKDLGRMTEYEMRREKLDRLPRTHITSRTRT